MKVSAPAPAAGGACERQGFSLYVHVPYCQSKCPYCGFNSYAVSGLPEDRYARAIEDELRVSADHAPWRDATVETIFFGGGTPSLLRTAAIGRLLDTVARSCSVAPDAEVTIEANPGTVERGRLAGLRRAGFNRLSIGIQSFQPDLLATLGRIHGPEDSRAAITAARAAGFENLNLDLIFGIPGQTRKAWEADLAELLRHEPEHVSTYDLTYEPGTPFHAWRASGRLRPLDEEDQLWMYEHARAVLRAAGYAQYEISNFARPGRAARHNRSYWRGADYLGLGAGAHSYVALPRWGRRWANERLPERYLAAVARGDPVAEREDLSFETAAAEFVFLGLREMSGIDPAEFGARFDRPLEEVHPEIQRLRDDGLLVERDGRLALSDRGLLLADSIFATLV